MKILVFETPEINVRALEMLREAGNDLVDSTSQEISATEVEAVLVKTYTKVDATFLQKYPQLRYVIRVGTGLDTIDVKYCELHGISVFNSPGANAEAVSEFVIGTMIWLVRRIQEQRQSLQNGNWRTFEAVGSDLSSQTLGIVGCGKIGSLVAQKARVLGIKEILGYDPVLTVSDLASRGIKAVARAELFSRSTVVSLHLPLHDQTRHSIGMAEFSAMPNRSYLINTSRGEILNESALLEAIDVGKIAGAALDVFSGEPQVNQKLINHPLILATPHIAGFTTTAQKQMAIQAVSRFISETTG